MKNVPWTMLEELKGDETVLANPLMKLKACYDRFEKR